MTRNILIALMVVATSLAMVASAMADIVNSRHNLSAGGAYQYKSTNEVEICVFCHTPHKPAERIPLWNRSVNDPTAYKLYTASATLTSATRGATLGGGISLKCLGCHDGTIGLGAGIFNPAQTPSASIAGPGMTDGIAASRFTYFGTDITNSHPVGMKYNLVRAEDPYFTIENAGSKTVTRFAGKDALPLFSRSGTDLYYVECASCHNPHGVPGAEKFLRMSNRSSLLCLTCHQK